MEPRTKRPAARTFKQERSKKTHEALVRAAAKVFAERGFDGAQTPDIAAEAGVSTGALYRYFKDKRALFIEVAAQHLAAASAAVAAKLDVQTFAGADVRASLDVVIDILFTELRRDPALSRVYLAMSLTDASVGELRARFEADERATLARLIEAAIPREVIADPEAAALVIQVAAVEVAADRAGLRPSRGRRVSDRAVKEALREMILRFLFPDGRASSEGRPSAEPREEGKRPRRRAAAEKRSV